MCSERNDVRCGSVLWYLSKMRDNLIVIPYRKYSTEEMESVIKNFIDFSVDGTIGVEDDGNKYVAVNGQKRLSAINNFVDGKIKYHGEFFEDLSDDEKEKFLKVTLCFVFLGCNYRNHCN